MPDFFKTALNDFTSNIAYGDAIRHLAKKGMTVTQIKKNLTYPASIEQIRDIVWKYYISSGIIRLEKPENNNSNITKTKYVIDRDKYGRSSYRKVEEIIPTAPTEYVPCDFGKRLYNDKENFVNLLQDLDKDDIDYILELPWPITTVYHIKNERISRIQNYLFS